LRSGAQTLLDPKCWRGILAPAVERISVLSFLSYKSTRLALLVVAGVCLAANRSYTADNSPTVTAPKRAVHSSMSPTHPTTTHRVARKTGTARTTAHSSTYRRATSSSRSRQSAAARTTTHASSASATKSTPQHTTAYASHRKGAPVLRGRPRPLTGRQRLARISLQPERVQEIQQALIREGYLQGDATGQWDSHTHEAMMRYQTEHGFPATGLPEAKSLMKLGLGSHPLPAELDRGTAGVASPAAPPRDLTVPASAPPVSQVVPPTS